MILLEYHNKIIEDLILERAGSDKHDPVEAIIADFDGVSFHLCTPDNNTSELIIEISIRCWNTLKQCGVDDILKTHYADNLTAPLSASYNAAIKVDATKSVPDVKGFARKIAMFKHHCMSAPFLRAAQAAKAKKDSPLTEVNYRDDEAYYIKADQGKLTCVFDVAFRDPDDVVFAKVFLQEYADARRSMTSVPAVTFYQKEPPAELQGVKNLRVTDENGFVTIVLFPNHLDKTMEKSVYAVMTFRNYLHYHLKCSKAYMHSRMREKTSQFEQILNRAKSVPEVKQAKTITGRTFTRQV